MSKFIINSTTIDDEQNVYIEALGKWQWQRIPVNGYIPPVSVIEGTEYRTRLAISIFRGPINYAEHVKSIKLILTAGEDIRDSFLYVGDYVHLTVNMLAGETLTTDITSMYKKAIKDREKELVLYIHANGGNFQSGGGVPKFLRDYQVEIDFEQEKSWHEARKNLTVADAGACVLDMLDGTHKSTFEVVSPSDAILGQPITHTIDDEGNLFVSVQESFGKNGNYLHVDSTGTARGIPQYHCYESNGIKSFANAYKSNISIESDGTLKYDGKRVYPYFVSKTGVEVLPSPKGYKGGDNFETRSDELREVEEQIANYKEALCEYVVITKDDTESITGEKFKTKFSDVIDEDSERNTFITTAKQENKLLLTKSEAINYESLCQQLTALDTQESSCQKSETSEELTLNANDTQILNYNEQIAILLKQKYQLEQAHSENYDRVLSSFENREYFVGQQTYYQEKIDGFDDLEEDDPYYENEEYFDGLHQSKKSARLQEQSYIDLLKSFVLIQRATPAYSFDANGGFLHNYDDWGANVEQFTQTVGAKENTLFYVMTKADAMNYLSVCMQISQLNEQRAILTAQKVLYSDGINEDAISDIETQRKAIALQKDTYISYQDKVIEEFERKVKEYGILLQRLNEIKQYEIVATIKDGDVLKGFNENGQIIFVSDLKGEKQARFEYENGKVARLYDEDGSEVKFSYDNNERISVITDAKGKKTTYTYGSNNITVTHSNGLQVKFTKSQEKLTKITNCYTGLATEFGYTNGKVTLIKQLSGNETLLETTLTYGVDGDNVTLLVASDDTTRTRYVIRPDMEIASILTEKAGKLIGAERYEGEYLTLLNDFDFNNNEYVLKTYTCHKNALIGKNLDNFVFDDDACTIEELFPNVGLENQSECTYSANFEHENVEYQQTLYTYDDKRRLVKEETEVKIKNSETIFISHTLYSYNNNGALTKKESYVEGEASTRGRDIIEYVYDKDGREVRSINYNTLSPSDKIYSEREYSEDGRLKCEYDERGLYKTIPVYNVDEVIGEKYPNGSTFVKSYDKYGNTVAITQSTDIGEENSTDRVYGNGLVKSVKSGNTTLEYSYDNKRRVNSVSLNGIEDYCTTTYEDNTTFYSFSDPGETNPITVDKVTTHVQGNVPISTYTDKLGKLLEIRVDGARVAHTYDDRGNLTRVYDTGTYNEELYYYDNKDKLTRFDRGTYFETHFYNPTGEVAQSNIGGITYDYTYSDDSRRELESIAVSGETIKPKKDALGRNIGKEIYNGNTMVARTKMNYVKHGDHTTNMPSTIQYMNGSGGIMYTVSKTLKYAYDNMGNISAIYDNGKLKCRYEYDTLNRLTREDNKLFGKTWTYFYDDNGNIIEKRTYTYTLCDTKDLEEKSYTYDENLYSAVGDRVERVNGYFVTYDDIGRVSQYKYMDCTWNKGKLIGLGSNTFTYDYKGRRTSKNGITFTYDSQGRLVEQSNGIKFIYDDTGVAGMIQGGSLYLYEKDAQGNIISLLDSQGFVVVRYEYDAWGVCKIYDTNGNVITNNDTVNANPFRYRGYYYDVDTGLYYLPARYYDPTTGRFISADDIEYADPEIINGLNLYAYCGNNPVMNIDPTGHDFWSWLLGALIVIGVTIVTAGIAGAAAFAIGSALGVGSSLVGATVTGALIGGLVSGGVELVTQGIATNWQSIDYGALAIESFTGSLYGAASGMMGSTTSVGLRLAMRGAIVATSGINATLHGINQGKSFCDIMLDVGISIGSSILLQGFMLGRDVTKGLLSKNVLMTRAIDGFNFILRHKLLLGGISATKNLWRNRNNWFKIILP